MLLIKKLREMLSGQTKKGTVVNANHENHEHTNRYKPIDPKTCPHAEGYVTAEAGMAQNFVCARCGALVNNTLFGEELLLEDARDRFPEIATQIKVELWKDPIYALMRGKLSASKVGTPNNT